MVMGGHRGRGKWCSNGWWVQEGDLWEGAAAAGRSGFLANFLKPCRGETANVGGIVDHARYHVGKVG